MAGAATTGRRKASKRTLWHPPLRRVRQSGAHLIIALAFLIGALTPSWHGATASLVPADFAELQTAFGGNAAEFIASICRHEDGGPAQLPGGGDHEQCKKLCLLCQALHHSGPALAQDYTAIQPDVRLAAKLAGVESGPLGSGGQTSGQARPRAPPVI